MKISSIPQIYRHLGRWGEILSVLSKYGLANWIGRLGPDFAKDLLKAPGGTAIARHRWETRLRLALSELGPSFIKLGQMLSTRPDLVGADLATELQHLQTEVSADPPETVREIIEAELGRPMDEVFEQFEEEPIASASIGQVHRARLKGGQSVAIKVQHADIERKVLVDLEILFGLAQLSERIPEFQQYRPRAIVSEFRRVLRRELDFRREERHMQLFAHNFEKDPTVHIPRPYSEMCTSRVLVMELVEGIKLSETDRLRTAGFDLNEIARRGANLYLEMLFVHSIYHADPHPGNVVLMEDNVIGLLDFGMVGRIDERLHEDIEELLLAVTSQDSEHLTAIVTRVGAVPQDLDRTALGLDMADFVAHYGTQSLENLDLSGALTEMTDMIRQYRISLPARVGLLIKVLISLEGTGRLLDPHFSLLDVMKPYRTRMLWRRLSPRRRIRKIRRFYAQVEHMIEALPGGVVDIIEQVQSGKFDVHLDHRGLEPSVNRLVLGMLASALFLGSSLLVSREVPPLVEHLPLTGWIPIIQGVSVPGIVGIAFSLALGLRLWRAINKSGRLDRRQ